nr:hypothetical protein [uncultured Draconibacterium sp.]
MNSGDIIKKEIKSTLKEIELFSNFECFTINKSWNNYLTNSKINIIWDSLTYTLNFELELVNEINPNDINFKKIGLNDDIVISSKEKTFVIPAFSINHIKTKRFVQTKKIDGAITCLFSKSLKYSDSKYFRLVVNINDENETTIFTGWLFRSDRATHFD